MCAFADLKVETISGEGDIKRMLCRQREHMEKTVSDLRTKLAKSAEEHEKAYVRIMKVKQKDFWINPPVQSKIHFLRLLLIWLFLYFDASKDHEVLRRKRLSSLQDNVSLIAEINELRKELQIQKSQVKDYRSQVSVLKKSNRVRSDSVNSQRQPKQEVVD